MRLPLFLGPPLDVSSEAWRMLGYWDIQQLSDDSIVAVHPNRHRWVLENKAGYDIHRTSLGSAAGHVQK